jgi:hypothetical protein
MLLEDHLREGGCPKLLLLLEICLGRRLHALRVTYRSTQSGCVFLWPEWRAVSERSQLYIINTGTTAHTHY